MKRNNTSNNWIKYKGKYKVFNNNYTPYTSTSLELNKMQMGGEFPDATTYSQLGTLPNNKFIYTPSTMKKKIGRPSYRNYSNALFQKGGTTDNTKLVYKDVKRGDWNFGWQSDDYGNVKPFLKRKSLRDGDYRNMIMQTPFTQEQYQNALKMPDTQLDSFLWDVVTPPQLKKKQSGGEVRNQILRNNEQESNEELVNRVFQQALQEERARQQEEKNNNWYNRGLSNIKNWFSLDNLKPLTNPDINLPWYNNKNINSDKKKCGGYTSVNIKPIDKNDLLHPADSDRLSYRNDPVGFSMKISKSSGPYIKKFQSGGNVAVTESDYSEGLNKGKNIFQFPRKGLKKMTMNPPSGAIEYPVKMTGLTDGKVTDQKLVNPGEDVLVNGDTIVETPDLSNLDFNEAIDYANRKKLPIFMWNGNEYPMRQHMEVMQEGGLFSSKVTDYTKLNPGFAPDENIN